LKSEGRSRPEKVALKEEKQPRFGLGCFPGCVLEVVS
jgi:hypothetical protein